MYRKNVASQYLFFGMITIATGAADTGASVTVKVAIDNAAQASGGGSVTNLGGGQYRYNMAQADTNGNNISFLFSASGDFIVEKTIVTTAADPTDGVRFGLSALPNTAVTTNGSLITSGAGTDQLTVSGGIASADAKKINGVSTSSVTTVNAHQGTTQPINFTGTAGSALVKSDTVDIAGAAVSTSTAQIGANVVNFGGVAGTFTSGRPDVQNVQGNVTGSVGSVTGSVGSVTGSVGSVVGNVGGSVASVTGSVGSVAGNVNGNVVGSVGSVVGSVGGSVASVTGAVGSVTGNVNGNLVGSAGSLTNTAVDNILDRVDAVEVGLTPRGAFRLNAAASAGVLAGAATSTVTIRNAVSNSKTRITATVDGTGNRSAVTTDVT